MAPTASRANWRVGTMSLRHAAMPNVNADEPEISVRSRSKNAACGPSGAVGPLVAGRVAVGGAVDTPLRPTGGRSLARRHRPAAARCRSARRAGWWASVVDPAPGDARARRRTVGDGRLAVVARRPGGRPARRGRRRRPGGIGAAAPASTSTCSPRGSAAPARSAASPACPATPPRAAWSARGQTATGRSGAERGDEVGERPGQAVRGLVEHDGAALAGQRGEPLGALVTPPRQEALHHEAAGRAGRSRPPRRRPRPGRGRPSPGGRRRWRPAPAARPDREMPGRAGVGHDGDGRARGRGGERPRPRPTPRCARWPRSGGAWPRPRAPAGGPCAACPRRR